MNADIEENSSDGISSSDTDGSDSSSDCGCIDSDRSDDEHPEVWEGDVEEFLQDVADDEPLPEPPRRNLPTQALTTLLQWLVYFLLLWQATCKISDNGLEWLLQLMFQFLHVMGITCKSEYVCQLAVMLPSSLYLLGQFVDFKRDNFVKFAVCPKCASLYQLENCTRHVGDQIVSSLCTYIYKPFRSKRECGAALVRKVILGSGKVYFYPHKLYCFNSIIDQVEGLLERPGAPEMCKRWRERQLEDDIIVDVYDGSIWKDFLKFKGDNFLNAPRNLAFAINVDWFQPFKRRNDRSVGVLYLVLLNLPKEERFKWENIILEGIVPEMAKEPKSLNTFLEPIVDELKALWKGVKLSTSQSSIPLKYRGALILV